MAAGIDLILADHERVNELFTDFDATHDAAYAGLIVNALIAHDEAEHGALYPLAFAVLGDADMIAKFDAAHFRIKALLEQVASAEGRALVDAVVALRAEVSAHVADEERDLLPRLEKAATPDQLEELATRIEHVKQRG